MSSNSISFVSQTQADSQYSVSSTKQATSTQPAVPKTQTTPAAQPQDEVKLSAAAQAKLLEQSGQSVSQIATSLALPTTTVEQYLGITADTETQILSAAMMKAAH